MRVVQPHEYGLFVGARSHYYLYFRRRARAAEQTRQAVLGYFANHRYAMDYAQYEKEGLPLGSGAVEGGCRLIGARTNGCGRRWSDEGCDRIVALRVAVFNNNLDALRPRPEVKPVAA